MYHNKAFEQIDIEELSNCPPFVMRKDLLFYPTVTETITFPSGCYTVRYITDFENLIEWNGFLTEV